MYVYLGGLKCGQCSQWSIHSTVHNSREGLGLKYGTAEFLNINLLTNGGMNWGREVGCGCWGIILLTGDYISHLGTLMLLMELKCHTCCAIVKGDSQYCCKFCLLSFDCFV